MNEPSTTYTQTVDKKSIASASILGLSIFLAVNALLLTWKPLADVDPESLPSAHTWVWWAAKEYFGEPAPPEVAVLGASLLMHPLSRADADFLNQALDYVHHHRSEYMAEALRRRLGISLSRCFNFALPGAMLSDDYMVLRAMLAANKKPRVIILGLGVRDFSDSLVSCPAATPPFRYLKRFAPIDDVVDLAMPQIWQRFDYWLGSNIYPHGKKLDIQVALSELAKGSVGKLATRWFPGSKLAHADPARSTPANMRAEVEEGWFIVRAHQPLSWEDNTREYKRRFRSANTQMFDIQEKFFSKFMSLCHQNNIRVVLVNIPVTAENRALVPPGNYERYVKLLQSESSRWKAQCVDLGEDKDFVKSDFYDTCHMNSSGGKKFIDKIVQAIAGDQDTVLALKQAGRSRIAGKQEFAR